MKAAPQRLRLGCFSFWYCKNRSNCKYNILTAVHILNSHLRAFQMKTMPFSHFEISQNHNAPRWLSSIYQNSLLINMLKTKITLDKTSFIF